MICAPGIDYDWLVEKVGKDAADSFMEQWSDLAHDPRFNDCNRAMIMFAGGYLNRRTDMTDTQGAKYTSPTTRYAVIFSPKHEEIAAYLPERYEVVTHNDMSTFIRGHDFLGWTLDAYVLPRLASGWFHGKELKADDFIDQITSGS